MTKMAGIPERHEVFDHVVREGTYGRMRMLLYTLAPSLIVQSAKLNGRLMGCYDAELEAITIDRTMILDDKKCALVHELAHWVYNDDSRPPYGAKREQATRKLTAETLISMDAYRKAETMYEGNIWLMAHELAVPAQIVKDWQRLVAPSITYTITRK